MHAMFHITRVRPFRRVGHTLYRHRSLIVLVVLILMSSVVALYPEAALAAPLGQAGTAFSTKLTALFDSLKPVARGLFGLALFVGLLMMIAEPALPSLARENRGAIGKAIFAGIAVGLVPDFVTLIMGA